MANIGSSYSGIADLNLWFRVRSSDDLTHADIPDVIPLRWPFFRDNWEQTLLPDVLTKIQSMTNPSILKVQLDEFTSFIDIQRNSKSVLNPFQGTSIFYKYYFVFDAINVDVAPITAQEQAIINKTTTRVSSFTKNDFLKIKDEIILARDQLADQVGGTDPNYNAIFNRSPIAATLSIAISDAAQMDQLQNAIKSVDFILANIFSLDVTFIDPFALAKSNANNPDFNINTYSSGRLVKLHYGESLEALADRYLGNPDKWIDIAIANGLKPPYMDEAGEALPLISNGNGNQINIAVTDLLGTPNNEKFFINQVVVLQSDTQFPQSRVVINIKQVPVSGELIIELDGDPNLDLFTIANGAYVRVFKPNTINSNFFILIPSNDGAPIVQGDTPWFLRHSSEDLKMMKIDLAISATGDLLFNPTNDFQLSFGLANAVQAMKLKILIEQGSLQRHPEFGFVSVQGTKNVNIEGTKQSIIDSINASVENDIRFDRIESIDVEYFGSGGAGPVGFLITMLVRLAGSSKTVPITFSVNIS
jgi:hypothetical protein